MLKINGGKTKLMMVGTEDFPHTQLIVEGQHVERFNQFKYLGTVVNDAQLVLTKRHSTAERQRNEKGRHIPLPSR